MVKLLPDRYTVACDYDGTSRPPTMPQLRAVLNVLGARCHYRRDDRTRRGWHMVLRLSTALEPAERIALELRLGSDPHRGLLDLMRVVWSRKNRIPRFWRRRAAMLFERKLAS